jgi:hypothetical protein
MAIAWPARAAQTVAHAETADTTPTFVTGTTSGATRDTAYRKNAASPAVPAGKLPVQSCIDATSCEQSRRNYRKTLETASGHSGISRAADKKLDARHKTSSN